MAAMLKAAENVFWSEKFWFSNGTSWKDLESTDPNIYYPKLSDMNMSFFVGLLLLGLRYVYERFLIIPIAKSFGLKDRRVNLTPNPALEVLYKSNKGKPSKTDIENAKKRTDLTELQIQRWFFKRKLKDVPSAIFRFKESSWHLLFYTTSFTYGMVILWNKPWLWDTTFCWRGWPQQAVTNDVYFFYLVELGFYWCLLFTVFYDIKRKDFYEMVTHHIITMALMYFSWVANYVRIGTLVLVVHDASDHWMAAAKMAKYLKHQTLCEVLFFIFILIWCSCRLYVYPMWILKTSYYEVFEHITPGHCFWLFNGMLGILQVLHIVWTCLILKVLVAKFTRGSGVRDVRSDSESEEDIDDTPTEEEELDEKMQDGHTKPVANGVSHPRSTRNHNSNIK